VVQKQSAGLLLHRRKGDAVEVLLAHMGGPFWAKKDEGVEVATATVRSRRTGQAIVDEARRRGVEVIVLGAEEPSRIRGGALLGGRGTPLDNFVGDVTRYVVEKAPCRVILTAPPADQPGLAGSDGQSGDGKATPAGAPAADPQEPD